MAMQQGDWKVLKAKIRNRFSKFNDSDLESLNGHMDELPNKVQKIYDYSKDKAIQESKKFTDSVGR